jgi:hypothetical protein
MRLVTGQTDPKRPVRDHIDRIAIDRRVGPVVDKEINLANQESDPRRRHLILSLHFG